MSIHVDVAMFEKKQKSLKFFKILSRRITWEKKCQKTNIWNFWVNPMIDKLLMKIHFCETFSDIILKIVSKFRDKNYFIQFCA